MTRDKIIFEQEAARMREAHAAKMFTDVPPGTFAERHYSVAQIGEMWNLSHDAVRKLFNDEPGVLVINNNDCRHRRRYRTLRIPESVVARVHRRMSKV